MSRAKAQSAAAILKVLSARLRLCVTNILSIDSSIHCSFAPKVFKLPFLSAMPSQRLSADLCALCVKPNVADDLTQRAQRSAEFAERISMAAGRLLGQSYSLPIF
jgi:hypothetical protein